MTNAFTTLNSHRNCAQAQRTTSLLKDAAELKPTELSPECIDQLAMLAHTTGASQTIMVGDTGVLATLAIALESHRPGGITVISDDSDINQLVKKIINSLDIKGFNARAMFPERGAALDKLAQASYDLVVAIREDISATIEYKLPDLIRPGGTLVLLSSEDSDRQRDTHLLERVTAHSPQARHFRFQATHTMDVVSFPRS